MSAPGNRELNSSLDVTELANQILLGQPVDERSLILGVARQEVLEPDCAVKEALAGHVLDGLGHDDHTVVHPLVGLLEGQACGLLAESFDGWRGAAGLCCHVLNG